MLPSISTKVNYNIDKTIEYPLLFMNKFIEAMYILSMKEDRRKSPSISSTLLELLSLYDEDDILKIDYSLLNTKLDCLESLLSSYLSNCIISSVVTSIFVNTFIHLILQNNNYCKDMTLKGIFIIFISYLKHI